MHDSELRSRLERMTRRELRLSSAAATFEHYVIRDELTLQKRRSYCVLGGDVWWDDRTREPHWICSVCGSFEFSYPMPIFYE